MFTLFWKRQESSCREDLWNSSRALKHHLICETSGKHSCYTDLVFTLHSDELYLTFSFCKIFHIELFLLPFSPAFPSAGGHEDVQGRYPVHFLDLMLGWLHLWYWKCLPNLHLKIKISTVSLENQFPLLSGLPTKKF